MYTALPYHPPIDPDELTALIVLEYIVYQKFYKRERPDLHSADNRIGVEVTRAYSPKYEAYTGKLYSDVLKRDIPKTPQKFTDTADVLSVDSVLGCIKYRIVDKMQKLNGYEQYPLNYLYVKSFLRSFHCELHTLVNMFDMLKGQIIQICENAKDKTGTTIPYKQFDVILIECADMFIIWDWKDNSLTLRPDVFEEYKKNTLNVNRLIHDEISNGVSATNNTPFKIQEASIKSLIKSLSEERAVDVMK